jgi:GNAT superfamily N-acetyltransferase
MKPFNYSILRTVEEMLPYHDVVIQMPYAFDLRQYETYLGEMIPNGYHQMVVLEGQECIGLAGFWISTKLYCGRYVELDNVIIIKGRQGLGIGKLLCAYIEAEAVKLGCTTALLDAYVENNAAHKFYFREGYRIRGYHFFKNLL